MTDISIKEFCYKTGLSDKRIIKEIKSKTSVNDVITDLDKFRKRKKVTRKVLSEQEKELRKEKRREIIMAKENFAEIMNQMVEEPVSNQVSEKIKEKFTCFKDKEITYKHTLSSAVLNDAHKNLASFNTVLGILGQKPAEKQELSFGEGEITIQIGSRILGKEQENETINMEQEGIGYQPNKEESEESKEGEGREDRDS